MPLAVHAKVTLTDGLNAPRKLWAESGGAVDDLVLSVGGDNYARVFFRAVLPRLRVRFWRNPSCSKRLALLLGIEVAKFGFNCVLDVHVPIQRNLTLELSGGCRYRLIVAQTVTAVRLNE